MKRDKKARESYAHNEPKFDAKSHNAARAASPGRVAHSAKEQQVTTTHRYAPASKAKSSRV
jgi:hypothetical protein